MTTTITATTVATTTTDLAGRTFGATDAAGNLKGVGVIVDQDGINTYCGYFVDGDCQGFGFIEYTTDDYYYSFFAGSFKDDKKNGLGVYVLDSIDDTDHVYFGNFQDGELVGNAWFQIGDAIYRLSVKDDSPTGCGIGLPAEGQYFEGCLEEGKRTGNGTLIYKNGDKYVGEFKNDLIHGYGVYYYSDGERYEGHWKGSAKDGFGKKFSADGSLVYSGNWMNGHPLG